MWGFFILKSWIELSHYTVYSYIPSCPGRGGVNSTQFFGPNEQFKNLTWQCCTVYMQTQSVKVLRYRVRFLIRIFSPDPTSVNPNLLPWATSRAFMLSPESSLHWAIARSSCLTLPLRHPDWTKIFMSWKFTYPLFRPLQVLSACTGALAHGGNDVGNCVGPLVLIYHVFEVRAHALCACSAIFNLKSRVLRN